MVTERRKHARHEVSLSGALMARTGQSECSIRNLSRGGALACSGIRIAANEEVTLVFQVRGHALEKKCTVIALREPTRADRMFQANLRFAGELDAKDLVRLQRGDAAPRAPGLKTDTAPETLARVRGARQAFHLEENKKIYDEHYDPAYLASVHRNVTEFLDKHYFRSRLIGFEEIPMRNNPPHPLIYVSNHSGMAGAWDAVMFANDLHRTLSFDMKNGVRGLSHPLLSQFSSLNPFFIDRFFNRVGAISATMENFETMMHYESTNLMLYPEGGAGMFKGFDRRYQLQKFSTSFIRMALEFRTDIIPVATVNAEYLNPYSYKSDAINRLVQKLTNIPFMPVGPLPALLPFFPWLFHAAMPAKLTFVRGETIKVYEMTDRPLARLTTRDIHRLCELSRAQMQRELDEAVRQYGEDPYELDELADNWLANADRILYILPVGWPLLFLEHERLFAERGGDFTMDYSNGAFLRALLRHPKMLAFLTPILGWPLLLNR